METEEEDEGRVWVFELRGGVRVVSNPGAETERDMILWLWRRGSISCSTTTLSEIRRRRHLFKIYGVKVLRLWYCGFRKCGLWNGMILPVHNRFCLFFHSLSIRLHMFCSPNPTRIFPFYIIQNPHFLTGTSKIYYTS